MMRLWVVLAIVLSAFTGYQGYIRGPRAVDWFTTTVLGGGAVESLAGHGFVSSAFALLLAVGTAFVLTFVIIALGDIIKTRQAISGLARLRQRQQEEGQKPDQRGFLAAFGEAQDMVSLAGDYSLTLHPADGAGDSPSAAGGFRATVPAATVFRSERLVEARLFAGFFRHLPAAICGIGALGLVFGLLDGLQRLRATAATAGWNEIPIGPLANGAQGGLIVLFAAVLLAIAVALVFHAMLALRHQQTGALCTLIDGLYDFGAEASGLRQVGLMLRKESAGMQRAVSNATRKLETAIGQQNTRLLETVEKQGRVAAKALGESIRASLGEPMESITAAVHEVTRDESERVRQLLDAALDGFVGQLEAHFGSQLAEVNELLKSSSAMASDIQSSFAALADTLANQLTAQAEAFSKELHASLAAERDRHAKGNKQLATQLKRFSTGLSHEVDRHSKRFDDFLTKTLERVDEITRTALATSGKDLAKTTAAFGGLQTVVESLTVSVTPILNQIFDTQERLLTAIDDESAAGKLIAGAATDLNAAARASRETVANFVALASELSETSRAIAGEPPIPRARPSTRPSRAAERRPRTKELGRALSDLRDETEVSSRDLPKL